MHEWSGLLLVISFAYAAAGVGLIAGLAGRLWARRGGRVPSAAQAAWCAALPVVAAALLPLSVFQPHPGPFAVLHDLWHAAEQALRSSPVAHALLHAANWGVLLLATAGLIRASFALARAHAFASSLHRLAADGPECLARPRVYLIRSERPLCFTMGVLRPSIYLSEGLRTQLSERDCEAMLAHEAAHAGRYDSGFQTLLSFFYALLPLPGTGLLMRDWQRASERACDAEAALRIGSAPDVAAALIRAAQAAVLVPGARCFTSAGEDIEGRVTALLGRPAPHQPIAGLVATGLAFLLAAGCSVYHAVELFVHH
jgi:beta-lactamase regulating signal transducer with metallopeptidase domain